MLQLRFLGQFEVVRDGERLVLPPSKKTRALLAYLAVTGRAHRRDRLCSLFWERPDDPRGALRWSLSKLRTLVDEPGRPRLVGDRETIAFDGSDVGVDLLELRRCVLQGLGRASTERLTSLADAIHGDFLEGLDLDDLFEFHAWCVGEREEARDLHRRILTTLVERSDAGPENALRYARVLAQLDQGDEEAHARLVRLLFLSNRRREAEQHYEMAKRVLREMDARAGHRLHRTWRDLLERSARTEPVPEPRDPGAPEEPSSADEAAARPPADRLGATFERAGAPERKEVTVLCAGLSPRANQAADMDPELALQRQDPALQAMIAAVHRYGGTVSGIRSDGITGLFGAPRAHEDHAVRACFAAWFLRDEVQRVSRDELTVRVGLHSGEVVVRLIVSGDASQYDAVGPVAQTAHRLVLTLEPGTIGLTDPTYRQARGFIEAQALGPPPVSGTDPAPALFELLGCSSGRTRWAARAAQGLARFVGRELELETLRRARDRVAAGRGEVVVVVGEPGIGKSRLVHEFILAERHPGWKILETGTAPYEAGTPYRPISNLLRSLFAVEERHSQAEIAGKVRAGVEALDPALSPALPVLFSLLDLPVEDAEWWTLSPAKRHRRTLDCLKALLVRLSQTQPLILLFEDLHWADAGSQAVLDALVESLGPVRILLLVTCRPEYRHEWSGKSCFSHIRLDPLNDDLATRLLGTLLGDDPGLRDLKRLLVERTEGTPLFLEEAVRSLVEAGELKGEPGRYALAGPVGRFSLPPSIQAVLAARIDRLSAPAKDLLQLASVIGKDVPLPLLAAVAHLPEERLLSLLMELQSAEFLYETRLLPHAEYTFKHALTHEVAYNSLLRERRRAIHVRLVHAIEDQYADRLDEQVERLAHHAFAGGMQDQAVAYLLRAANRAIQRSAHGQAIDHLSRGLEVIGTLPDSRRRAQQELEYQKAMGVALMAARGWGAQEVSDAYKRAQILCEQLGDGTQLFTVLRGQGQFHMIRGELQTARVLGERCLELADATTDEGVRIETHHLFWSNSFFMGDYANARIHSQQGIGLYDRERHHRLTYTYSGHDPGVCCRCFSGLVLWQQGFPEQALQHCRESLSLAERLSHPLTLALAHWGLSYLFMFQRKPEEARHWAEQEISVCREYLLPLLLSQGMFQNGWALAELGELEEGIARMNEGLASIGATGAEMGLPYFVALLGAALARSGQVEAGLGQVERALAMASANGARFQLPEILRLKGELLLMPRRSNPQQSERFFREAMTVAAAQGAKLVELRAALSLARLLAEQGRRCEGYRALAPFSGRFAEGSGSPDLTEAAVLLDALA